MYVEDMIREGHMEILQQIIDWYDVLQCAYHCVKLIGQMQGRGLDKLR